MPALSRVAAGFALSVALLMIPSSAHAATCAGADSRGGTSATRTAALRCLVTQTRAASGLAPLRRARALSTGARRQATAITRCGTFSHNPCGRTAPSRCTVTGENLAWAPPGATPREILALWLASPGHRANILSAQFGQTGFARRTASLNGLGRGELWVQEFGVGC